MPQLPSVLIVEPRADERDVLSTVLARRGMRIWQAAQAAEGLELAHEHRPDVIVLDADCEAAVGDVAASFGAGDSGEPALVILGRIDRASLPHASHVVAKPYHYGPLIHKIEQLAARSKAA
jgi:DNA-binding response OmpR family regulator